MRGEGDLYDLIEDYIGDPLPLHVYNVDRNQVREVVIVPSEEWGGEGLLGCDVGYGYVAVGHLNSGSVEQIITPKSFS